MGLVFKIGAAAVGILILGVVGILLFEEIWYQVGLGAAIVVVCGGLLLFASMVDRKDRAARAGLDDI